ncbi:MAG: hypothetical protein ACFFG0_12525 [Candidatus Thorarchaeota archaeon]
MDEDNENKKIEINTDSYPERGVCAFNCKIKAITMVKKFTIIPAETMRDAMVRNIKGRIKKILIYYAIFFFFLFLI